MFIQLMNVLATPDTVDKLYNAKSLGNQIEVNDTFDFNSHNTVITLDNSYLHHPVNYVIVSDDTNTRGGYYFIDDKIQNIGGTSTLVLRRDVLTTAYKNNVLQYIAGTLTECIDGDKYYDNGSFLSQNKEETQVLQYPDGFNENGEYILIVAGGEASE